MKDVPPPPTFDEWWAVYPRKQGKKKAEQIYDKLPPEKKSACYLGTLHHVDHNRQWADERFIPMPTTFLNQERWADDVPRDTKEKIKSEKPNDAAGLVWIAMVEFFGQKWIKEHGEKPSEIWRKMLAPLPEHRLKRGLRKCFESGSDFPPSLPKFMEYCARTFGEESEERALWDQERLAQLPPPEGVSSDPIKADEAFQEMFKILGVSK